MALTGTLVGLGDALGVDVVGPLLGISDGTAVGFGDGMVVGTGLGLAEGSAVGFGDGICVGSGEGFAVAVGLIAWCATWQRRWCRGGFNCRVIRRHLGGLVARFLRGFG